MAEEEPAEATAEEPAEGPVPSAPLATPSIKELLDALNAKLRVVRGEGETDITCPICQKDDWTIGDMAEIRVYEPGRIGGQIFPVVPLFCTTCGYAIMFNAIALGIERRVEPLPRL